MENTKPTCTAVPAGNVVLGGSGNRPDACGAITRWAVVELAQRIRVPLPGQAWLLMSLRLLYLVFRPATDRLTLLARTSAAEDLLDMGVVPVPVPAGNSFWPLSCAGWETTVKVCGVPVARPQGHSWAAPSTAVRGERGGAPG